MLNNCWIFDAGNHFDLTAAVLANLNVDVEDSLQSLYPGHGAMVLLGRLIQPLQLTSAGLTPIVASITKVYDMGRYPMVISDDPDH